MKSASVILFIVGLLLLLGLYIYVDDRFTKMDARLQGAESALNTLEPFRSMLARGPGQPEVANPYEPVQATGEPNAAAEGRDSAMAWCPATENGGEEWLLLDYGEGIDTRMVRVVANYQPGAVVQLVSLAEAGAGITLWSGPAARESAGFVQEITVTPRKVERLRVVLDTAAVEGWNEIDAVGLVDGAGEVHWAVGAEASSFWVKDAGEKSRQGP